MTPDLCDRVHAFLDGELSAADAEQFRDHLATCSRCAEELEAGLQLAALMGDAAVEQSQAEAGVVSLAWYRRRRTQIAGATVALAVAAAAAFLLFGRARPAGPVALALAPTRSIEARVAWSGADRYRPYEVLRSTDGQKSEPVPLADLARLEEQGDRHGVGALYLLDADWQRAADYLPKSSTDPRVRTDRAVMLLGQHQPGAALALLDPVLRDAPELGPALWNRALALRDLGLPLSAATAFEAVAGLQEPGWADEARERARALRDQADRRRAASAAVIDSAHRWIRDRADLPADFATGDRGLARGFFYDLVRSAPTRARAESLRPLAEDFDRDLGSHVLRDLVDRVAGADFATRGPLAARYGQLVLGELPADRIPALLRDARRARLDDLVMGVMLRDDNRIDPDEMPEYARLVANTGDPWFAILEQEMRGRNRSDADDYAGAEAALLAGRELCRDAPIEFRCGRIEAELGNLYILTNRVAAAGLAIGHAREAALRGGDWYLQELTTRMVASIPTYRDDSFGSHLAEARAYLVESVALSPDDCELREWADGELASLLVDQLRFDDARAQLDSGLAAAGGCAAKPSLGRAFVLAQVAAATGDDALASQVSSMVDRMRAGGAASVDDEIRLDHIAGRVRLASDRAGGQALLRKAIATADAGAGVGTVGQRYRAYSYSVLVADAARHQEYRQVFDLLAQELGTPRVERCALGVAVEVDRVVVAMGADGQVAGWHRRLEAPVEGAAGLVDRAALDRLAGCDTIDVYARPPVLGQPELLPADRAWRYRVGAGNPARSPLRSRRLVVADPEPPAALGLAPLDARIDADQPDTLLLRGAAATPRRVRAAMASATEIEIHAHGSIDGTSADTAWIVLSPQEDGSYALTAREVAATRLTAAPVVFLATCHGARPARFFHEGDSLALAFIRAGARIVVASTGPIPDHGAADLFAQLRLRMSHGASAAQALSAIRSEHQNAAWMRYLVVFE